MDAALVALRRDLKALGFQRAEHSHDPEDHLAALAEVMAMLIEARAPDEARFFMDHLAPWAAECLADLGRVDTPSRRAWADSARPSSSRRPGASRPRHSRIRCASSNPDVARPP